MKANYSNSDDPYKIVFFGASFAGKRSNIDQLITMLSSSDDGAVVSQDSQGPFRLVGVQHPKLFNRKILLTTVENAPDLPETELWSPAMRGAHGIVFVVDSDFGRYEQNINAMRLLIVLLSSFRTKIEQFPCIVQYNKRDLDTAVPIAKFEDELNPLGLPAFNAVASEGKGVMECLQAIYLLIQKSGRQRAISGHQRAIRLN